MKVSWRVLALASGVVLGAMVGAACTVTSSSDDDAGDLFADSGSGDTSTGGDTGTTDSGSSCTAIQNAAYVDGGVDELLTSGFGSSACDDCMNQNCCGVMGACFEDPTGQCQELEDCLNPTVDAGDDGGFAQTCADLYPDSIDLHNTWSDCQTHSCAAQCP